MGVGRSPFIHCSQRLLFWEMGGPRSLQAAEAGLSGGASQLWGTHILPATAGKVGVVSTPLLGDCSVVPEACFLSGCCKVIK